MGGKYKDSIWCDVVPMDVFHVLLGRPWQFNRCVIHDGRANTYTFQLDSLKIVLLSHTLVTHSGNGAPSVMLVTRSAFEQELENAEQGFLLLVHDIISSVEAPNIVRPLLHEFVDLFPPELPDGLPPLRDIQHQVNLVPGASLPNKPHYRMSLLEHAELCTLVKNLLCLV